MIPLTVLLCSYVTHSLVSLSLSLVIDPSGIWSLKLDKGRRTRWEEDNLASLAVIKTAASLYTSLDNATIEDDINLELFPSESFEGQFQEYNVDEAIRLILSPQDLNELPTEAVEIVPSISSSSDNNVQVLVGSTRASMLLPGSFNPIHHGHRKLLDAARLMASHGKSGTDDNPSNDESTTAAAAAAYELSVSNPDKGLLCFDDVKKRVEQFLATGETVVLTRCPLYADKVKFIHL